MTSKSLSWVMLTAGGSADTKNEKLTPDRKNLQQQQEDPVRGTSHVTHGLCAPGSDNFSFRTVSGKCRGQ